MPRKKAVKEKAPPLEMEKPVHKVTPALFQLMQDKGGKIPDGPMTVCGMEAPMVAAQRWRAVTCLKCLKLKPEETEPATDEL